MLTVHAVLKANIHSDFSMFCEPCLCVQVYVEAVDTVSALVDWKCQICCKDGDTSGKPLHTMIMGEDFKK